MPWKAARSPLNYPLTQLYNSQGGMWTREVQALWQFNINVKYYPVAETDVAVCRGPNEAY